MAQSLIAFPALLRDLLVKRQLTPSALAAISGIQPQSIQAWLSASQLPKAASVWAIARALGGHEHELLQSALFWHHSRTESVYPVDTVLRLDKSASAYFGEANWWQRIPRRDQRAFLRVWQAILERQTAIVADVNPEPSASDLILLPAPTLIVIDEWAELIKHIAKDSSQLYSLNWKRFEDLVAELLQRYGWETTPMGYTKDDGIDIVAATRHAPDVRFTMLVQCKRFAKNHNVGVDIVREVWSVKWEKGFHNAMIATTSTFTRGAKQKGQKWDLALKDHDAIVDWCKGLQSGIVETP